MNVCYVRKAIICQSRRRENLLSIKQRESRRTLSVFAYGILAATTAKAETISAAAEKKYDNPNTASKSAFGTASATEAKAATIATAAGKK